jgi:neutral ceramidase
VSLQVGFASAVITPDPPVVLAGFGGRSGPATGVRHDLTVQAVVVTSGDTTLCLLVLDLLLLGADVAGPLRHAVATALGIESAEVMTSCTHTHAGPAATRAVRRAGWPIPAGYQELLMGQCCAAALAARAAARPATLAYGRADLPAALSLNRRGLPYRPSFSVLDVRGADGGRLGSIAGVSIHPVALGVTCTQVSGDWVSTFRDRATESSGAPAVLLSGALGDVNPLRDPHVDPDVGGNWETARLLGTEVADCVTELLAAAAPIPAAASALPPRRFSARAGLTLPALLAGVALRKVDIELLEWSLGGVRLVSVPGEAFHELGRRIEQVRDDKALLAGLSPDYRGYLPMPYARGYEEKMSYGRSFVGRLARELTVVPA